MGGVAAPSTPLTGSECEPYRDMIEAAVASGRSARAIWEDLTTRHKFKPGYECVKRFVRTIRGPRQRPMHPWIVTDPGEEMQVDYGTGPLVLDPETDRHKRTRLFALTLGYSRKSVWLLSWRSSSKIWVDLHERAFRSLGGTTKTLVLDNLREGVIKPDTYDPVLNTLFKAFLEHYDVVAIPARVRDPNRKGKVESAVGYAQTRFVGKLFASLGEAQAYVDEWAATFANTRVHGTTKRRVDEMFAEEQHALRALPTEPFRAFDYGVRVVRADSCVEVLGAYYSVPPGRIGERVNVQWDDQVVRALDPGTGQLLREHQREKPGRRTVHPDDRGERRAAEAPDLLRQAYNAGDHVGTVCDRINDNARDPALAIRETLGVLSLVKKHGAVHVEDACRFAMEAGFPQLRFVRRYVERKAQARPGLRQVDSLIRELSHSRDVIDAKTES